MSLLARFGLALLAVGLVPLSLATVRLSSVGRQSLTTQVLATHALAAGATADRLASLIASLELPLEALGRNAELARDPRSGASRDLLAAALEADERALGLVVSNREGGEVIRVQRKGAAAAVELLMATSREARAAEALESGRPVLRLRSRLVDGAGDARGALDLVADVSSFADVTRPAELMDEAVLAVGTTGGTLLFSSHAGTTLASFAPALVTTARAGKLAGAGRFASDTGGSALGAYAPVPGAGWFVVSQQPARVAERVSLAMAREASLVVVGAVLLSFVLCAFAYRSVVRPLRELAVSQRRVAGLSPGGVRGDEIESLRASFAALASGLGERDRLGEVFLGRYQVISLLGSGGMGTVFRGWDPKLKRPVALKTVRLAKERTLPASLVQEAVTIARFSHPNIVQVYDVEDSDEAAFIAMELVDGIGLDGLLKSRHQLPVDAVVPLALAMARALQAAHERGVVHRDVKPANVLLGRDGEIKMTDFGISQLVARAGSEPGALFGTPGYLPPEALRGEVWGPQGDLFSLGVVLYQMLAGRRPFLGPDAETTLRRTLRDEPPPLEVGVPGLPPELSSLVSRLLVKVPSGRPATASVVVEELERLERRRGYRWTPEILPSHGKKELDEPLDPHSAFLRVSAGTVRSPARGA